MKNPLSQIAYLTLVLDEELSRIDRNDCVILAIETAIRVINQKHSMNTYIELSQAKDC